MSYILFSENPLAYKLQMNAIGVKVFGIICRKRILYYTLKVQYCSNWHLLFTPCYFAEILSTANQLNSAYFKIGI